jgi:hypothetical protein
MEKEQTRARQQGEVRPEPQIRSTALDVVIPYKSPELTALALEYAMRLGHGLDMRLRLIDVHVVPYELPLDKPAVRRDHLENELRKVANRSAVPILPELIFARDWEAGFRRTLRPHSVVLIPIQKTWWKSHDKRMAERLRKHGHQVIWVEYVLSSLSQ